MMAKKCRVSSWGDENILKLTMVMVLHNTMNILKTTEFYTLNG